MSRNDFDLDTLQEVVELGPYRLVRCGACRGANIASAVCRCCWCGAPLSTEPSRERTAGPASRHRRHGPRSASRAAS